MSNPPPDRSQLWTNPLQDTSDEARKAAIAAQEAQNGLNGVSFAAEGDQDFLKRKYEGDAFAARQRESAAQFGAKQYEEQQFAIRQHNEPIEAAIRKAEEERTAQIAADAAKMVTTAAVAGAVAAEVTQPGLLAGTFAGMFGMGGPEPVTRQMGPSAMFGGLAATPAQLGIKGALDYQLGPVRQPGVAIDAVAQASPHVAAELQQEAKPAAPRPEPPPAPSAQSQAVLDTPNPIAVQRPQNMAMELHNNSLANGPKRPSWAAETPIGGGMGS